MNESKEQVCLKLSTRLKVMRRNELVLRYTYSKMRMKNTSLEQSQASCSQVTLEAGRGISLVHQPTLVSPVTARPRCDHRHHSPYYGHQLCCRGFSFTYSRQRPCETRIIIPILKMKTFRLRDIKQCVQCHKNQKIMYSRAKIHVIRIKDTLKIGGMSPRSKGFGLKGWSSQSALSASEGHLSCLVPTRKDLLWPQQHAHLRPIDGLFLLVPRREKTEYPSV